ncbi:MAG: hypothetical protein ABI220_00535 [Candidatus Saccharimonadales bacterium]
MPKYLYSQNNNESYNNPYTPDGYGKVKLKKLLLLLTVSILVVIAIIIFVVHLSQPESQQSKYIKSATAAARKKVPNAEVTKIEVTGGFASAMVNDPTADGQANSGSTTIFKVNSNGSMEQLASGSEFGPIDLLGLGIPLTTQANLTRTSVKQVKQALADQCGYGGNNIPGYSGFGGSFGQDEWRIDAARLNGLELALSDTISNQNAEAKPGKTIICVDATRKNSSTITDTKTYISTITLQLLFITGDGTSSTHITTLSSGPNYYHNYTLDGRTIQ